MLDQNTFVAMSRQTHRRLDYKSCSIGRFDFYVNANARRE